MRNADYLNLAMIGLGFYMLHIYNSYKTDLESKGTAGLVSESEQELTTFYVNMVYVTKSEKIFYFHWINAAFALLVWGRTILSFEYTSTFGPLIKMIIVMI
jgi:hypothetical protein